MAFTCYKCSKSLELGPNNFVARADECPACRADLHCCYNCKNFDSNSYNQCREPQAERVVDKDRRNFCDYFAFAEGAKSKADPQKASALKKLDDLFKK